MMIIIINVGVIENFIEGKKETLLLIFLWLCWSLGNVRPVEWEWWSRVGVVDSWGFLPSFCDCAWARAKWIKTVKSHTADTIHTSACCCSFLHPQNPRDTKSNHRKGYYFNTLKAWLHLCARKNNPAMSLSPNVVDLLQRPKNSIALYLRIEVSPCFSWLYYYFF